MAIYIVKSGDTLSKIASKFAGVTVAAIVQANGITNANFIRIGQQLTIPTPGIVSQPISPLPFLQPLKDALGRIVSTPATTTTTPAASVPANAALRGDVISFILEVGRPYRLTTGYTAFYSTRFKDTLNARGYSVISFDDSGVSVFTGGAFKGTVQINHAGHADISHAGSTILGIAADIGFNATNCAVQFVSKARDGGGTSQVPIVDPNNKPKGLADFEITAGMVLGAGALLLGVWILKRDG